MNRLALFAAALLSVASLTVRANAQASAPPGQAAAFRDTSMLKLPTGSKVAIYEFEDLECPACSRDAPIVRGAIQRYKLPYLRP